MNDPPYFAPSRKEPANLRYAEEKELEKEVNESPHHSNVPNRTIDAVFSSDFKSRQTKPKRVNPYFYENMDSIAFYIAGWSIVFPGFGFLLYDQLRWEWPGIVGMTLIAGGPMGTNGVLFGLGCMVHYSIAKKKSLISLVRKALF